MTVVYDKAKGIDATWIVYCIHFPDIKGTGKTQAEALDDLTDKVRAIMQAVYDAQKKLCENVDNWNKGNASEK